MGPREVENSSTDERILNKERVEEWRSVHDEATQEDVPAARYVARQLPQTVMMDVAGAEVDITGAVVDVFDAVMSDLFERLAHQSPYPDADIGGYAVHQTESSDEFEFLDVQLLNQLNLMSNQVSIQYLSTTNHPEPTM